MKWMGGWGWREYLSAPADLVEEAARMMETEFKAIENASRGKKSSQFHVERDAAGRPKVVRDKTDDTPSVQQPAATEIDPRTGREVVTKVKDDGTVVKHRKIEEGEQLLHMMFGKPKSFQNK